MKEIDIFRKQFLLTTKDEFDLSWNKEKILHLNLFYHPEIEITHISENEIDIYLLGFIFDYKNPEFSNQNILDSFSGINTFDEFIKHLAQYSGHFVIILSLDNKIILLGDACGQYEIYYDTTFSTFGSQPKLISKVIPLKQHSSNEARRFYASRDFQKESLFIGDTTHVENIKHLLPNHYIDIIDQSVHRYFPCTPIIPISINDAVPAAIEKLKGFIQAASLRNELVMGLTAGYDSRVLFLSSLNVNCKYYVTRHPQMTEKHYDICVPKKISRIYNKDFRVVTEPPLSDNMKELLEQSVDFSRTWTSPDKSYNGHLLINGNLSEIARNYYGRLKKANKSDLASLRNLHGSKYAQEVFGKWKEDHSKSIEQNDYHLLDFFYWEERMGIWSAKTKTEGMAIGMNIYSPFCSHDLLITLLSTPRKFRDAYNNVLYDLLLKSLSQKSAKIPINPSTKQTIYKLSHKLHIYRIIQRTRMLIKNLYRDI